LLPGEPLKDDTSGALMHAPSSIPMQNLRLLEPVPLAGTCGPPGSCVAQPRYRRGIRNRGRGRARPTSRGGCPIDDSASRSSSSASRSADRGRRMAHAAATAATPSPASQTLRVRGCIASSRDGACSARQSSGTRRRQPARTDGRLEPSSSRRSARATFPPFPPCHRARPAKVLTVAAAGSTSPVLGRSNASLAAELRIRTPAEITATATPNKQTIVAPIGQSFT
jgi:hypothetical protein